jgi:hypothetical protein
VKLQAVLNAPWRFLRGPKDVPGTDGSYVEPDPYKVEELNFDHRPPLCDRPYDTVAGDFIPPQNDPNHIDAIPKPDHDKRTFGREPGALKTVTTRGSDMGERARTSDIRAADAVHRARIAAKSGRPDLADEILAGTRFKKKHTRPKAKIPQRKNPWGTGKRPFPKR